ncbi:protein of unknown function (plasmid) [Cupriavidus taiwanensis]|uniref:Uncharacterized protein n=1 Tax=Cupriavidus taiwanensis TaxID=164546 RepID=A0A9Q7UXE6_9BURK|nr:protein of unknown function [Cupriavidus taiwanensis]
MMGARWRSGEAGLGRNVTKSAVGAGRGYNSDWHPMVSAFAHSSRLLPQRRVLLYNRDEISYFQGYHYVNQIFSG